MAKLTSFQADIRPLFTERDIQGMKKAFNLASYDDVKVHAAAIYDRIRGIGGTAVVSKARNPIVLVYTHLQTRASDTALRLIRH
jgi:hypothetical protein